MEDPEAVGELVADVEAVIHCAGAIAAYGRRGFDAANVAGTSAVVRAAAAQPDPPKFILLSSLAAREPHLSHYAASKRQAEIVAGDDGRDLDRWLLRAPAVYGPGDKATLPLFRLLKHGFMPQPTAHGRFSMIYVEDLVVAIETLAATNSPGGPVMELDDGYRQGYGWRDLADEAEKYFGRRIRLVPTPRPLLRSLAALGVAAAPLTGRPPVLSQGKVNEMVHSNWVCHNARMDDLTDWRAKTGLQEGFSKTIDWYIREGWL